MVIYTDQWHFRLYLWSRQILRQFRGSLDYFDDQRERRFGVNLCPYIRTLMLWMPLVVALHLIVFGLVAYVYVIMPFQLFGAMAIGIVLAKVLAAVITGVVFFGIIVGLVKLFGVFMDWRADYRIAHPVPEVPVGAQRPQRFGFFKLLGAYLRAAHDKICPHIEVKEV